MSVKFFGLKVSTVCQLVGTRRFSRSKPAPATTSSAAFSRRADSPLSVAHRISKFTVHARREGPERLGQIEAAE